MYCCLTTKHLDRSRLSCLQPQTTLSLHILPTPGGAGGFLCISGLCSAGHRSSSELVRSRTSPILNLSKKCLSVPEVFLNNNWPLQFSVLNCLLEHLIQALNSVLLVKKRNEISSEFTETVLQLQPTALTEPSLLPLVHELTWINPELRGFYELWGDFSAPQPQLCPTLLPAKRGTDTSLGDIPCILR